MKILLIEDDIKITTFLKKGLEEEGYIVDISHLGDEGVYLASINEYDLILLDIMLPNMNGFDVCRKIRGFKRDIPIIMLSARDTIDDKVLGLDIGANDYISKPFSFAELLARVRVQLRVSNSTDSVLKIADLELDISKKRAIRSGKSIKLTAKEFLLLEFMIRNRDKVLSESLINSSITDLNEITISNVVNVYIYRLRNKIDKGFDKQLIKTVRGMGFIISEE